MITEIPEKLKVLGKTYKITKDKKLYGASFQTGSLSIKIGTAGGFERSRNSLMHEILEIILVELGYRYDSSVDSEFMFIFNHSQFRTFSEIFSGVLVENNLI